MCHAKRITYRFQIKHIGQDWFFFHFIVPLLSLNIFLNWLISSYIFQFHAYLYKPFLCLYHRRILSFVVYLSYFAFHYFYPFILAIFLMKKAYNGSSLSTWFFYLIVIRLLGRFKHPPSQTACPFSFYLTFFYPLYIHTRLTPPSPSVAKRRWRHALRHNPHPPT